jgi:hypothetical protein
MGMGYITKNHWKNEAWFIFMVDSDICYLSWRISVTNESDIGHRGSEEPSHWPSVDFTRPGYDIHSSPWLSHGPNRFIDGLPN